MNSRSLIGFAVAALIGCSTAATSKGEATISRAEVPIPCALGVDGAEVTVEDTLDGVMLTFATERAENVDELRTRARNAASMYGPRRAGLGHGGMHAQGGHHGLMPMQLPPSYASTEDIGVGVRMRLTPVDPQDLAPLRAKIRERAVAMSTSCR